MADLAWLVDECVDIRLAERLRDAGYDVTFAGTLLAGTTDRELIDIAQRENRLLLTEDKDFGDLVFHRFADVPGVVLLRVEPPHFLVQRRRLEEVITTLGVGLYGRFVVVQSSRVRSRPLASASRG